MYLIPPTNSVWSPQSYWAVMSAAMTAAELASSGVRPTQKYSGESPETGAPAKWLLSFSWVLARMLTPKCSASISTGYMRAFFLMEMKWQ